MISFSIVIPTYNRPDALNACLRSLTRLEYPDWEVIVVNDGGQAPQPFLAQEALDALAGRLRIVTIKNGGPCVARNTGAALATRGYLAFTDDDCEVQPNWLTELAAGFETLDCDGIGGEAVNAFPESSSAVAFQQYITFVVDQFKMPDGRAILVMTNNAAYKRGIFEALGGFNEQITRAEDWEFGSRLYAAGYRQYIWRAAQVRHQHPRTLRELFRKQFVYGVGEIQSSAKQSLLLRTPAMSKNVNRQRLNFLREQRVPLRLYPLFFLNPLAYHYGQWVGRRRAQQGVKHAKG